MPDRFDAIRGLIDVDHIDRRVKLLIIGGGRVGRAFAFFAPFHGVEWIRIIEPDWVSRRNFAGGGTPENAVGMPKVEQLLEEITRISPRISIEGESVELSADNLTPGPLAQWLTECTHAGIFIDTFGVASPLARAFYRRRPCIYAGLTDDGLTGLAAWSLLGQTPCLACSAGLPRRQGGDGGQTLLVDTFDVVSVAFRMFLGLCLIGRKGFERFARHVNPRFCLAEIINIPDGFLDMAKDRLDIPSGVRLVEVVDEHGRGPSCSSCRGYAP